MPGRQIAIALLLVWAALAAGCTADSNSSLPVVVVDGSEQGQMEEAYHLGVGDTVRLLVYNEPSLSGEFEVDGLGYVSLPLIAEVEVRGLTLREFEAKVAERLGKVLVEPRVSAEVTNYRPFYVTGEVKSAGEYPYSEGLTMQKAIALAGGHSTWADQSRVLVDREGREELLEVRDPWRFRVLPGDTIRVPQRKPFF